MCVKSYPFTNVLIFKRAKGPPWRSRLTSNRLPRCVECDRSGAEQVCPWATTKGRMSREGLVFFLFTQTWEFSANDCRMQFFTCLIPPITLEGSKWKKQNNTLFFTCSIQGFGALALADMLSAHVLRIGPSLEGDLKIKQW